MGAPSKPLYRRQTHPTTAEVGLFGPLLFRCHTPASIFIIGLFREHRFTRIGAGWISYANGIVKDTLTGSEWKAGPDRRKGHHS